MSEPTAQTDAQSQTKWLTAEQQEAWLTLIALVTRLPAALDTQLQRDSALTHFEYFVLAALSDAPDHKLQQSPVSGLAGQALPSPAAIPLSSWVSIAVPRDESWATWRSSRPSKSRPWTDATCGGAAATTFAMPSSVSTALDPRLPRMTSRFTQPAFSIFVMT